MPVAEFLVHKFQHKFQSVASCISAVAPLNSIANIASQKHRLPLGTWRVAGTSNRKGAIGRVQVSETRRITSNLMPKYGKYALICHKVM